MLVRYSDGVETIRQGEAETSEQIAATVLDIVKKVGARQRHTVRAVHAKSHGLLKAEVTVFTRPPRGTTARLVRESSKLQRGHALLDRSW